LEQERQRIKNNEPEASKDPNNLKNTKQNYMTPLSSSRPLIHEELKKMIKCFSLISKINMSKITSHFSFLTETS